MTKNYILKNFNSIFYEVGWSCDNVIFLSIEGEKFFITDGRYTFEAEENTKNCKVIDGERSLTNKAVEVLKDSGVKEFIFDPKEWNVSDFNSLQLKLPDIKFSPIEYFSHKKRVVKTAEEIEKIKKAVELGRKGFKKFASYLQKNGEGKSEKKLHWKVKEILTNAGEVELSFDPIVAINENGAKPHAIPTTKTLQYRDLILMDAGVKYCGYCSDRTRTSFFSEKINFKKNQKFSNIEIQKIYDTVQKAHDVAIESVKAGMKASELDKIARDIIFDAGYGDKFIHSLGHGVGLDIHEMPYISSRSETILEEGMVFTIEPGIYIPNFCGVRIEDMVFIKNGKAEII